MFGGGKSQISYLKFDLEILTLQCPNPDRFDNQNFYAKFVIGKQEFKTTPVMFKENGGEAKKILELENQKFEGVASFVLDKNFEWQNKKCWFKIYS